jgi:hypothetical protein
MIKELGEVKIRHHFQSPTKLPTLLSDATVVAQLWRPLADKSENNLELPKSTEVCRIM